MTRLIVRLILSIAAFPLMAFVTVLLGDFLWAYGYHEALKVIRVLMMIGMWVLIWRKCVIWKLWRVAGTLLVTFEASFAAWMLLSYEMIDDTGMALVGLALSSIPMQLVLVWRNRRCESSGLLPPWKATPQSHCPRCLGRIGGGATDQCSWCADVPAAAGVEDTV